MKVYFYSNYNDQTEGAWHDYICLAEGFKALGHSIFSNINMYIPLLGSDFLIKETPEFSLKEADIIFLSSYLKSMDNFNGLFSRIKSQISSHCLMILVDTADGIKTPGFCRGARVCDYVLKAHYSNKMKYPSNFIPWQLGISNRQLQAVQPIAFKERRQEILVSFRCHHQLREYINKHYLSYFEPYLSINITDQMNDIIVINKDLEGEDLLKMKQTGGRHNMKYFEDLSTMMTCACYGGVLGLPWGNYNKYSMRIARELNNILPLLRFDRVRQWDSWRFWESMAAGCCSIHIDLEKYGCVLPVMPRSNIDYISIDPAKKQNIPSILINSTKDSFYENIENIAKNGRNFILEHYTPRKVVERLLRTIGL